MKIFQVDDEHIAIIESVLDGISRCPAGQGVNCFAFGMEYTDRQYSTGYVDASPHEQSNIAGYIMLDANLRYVVMNRDKFEEDEEDV